ncbi:MAG: ATP cone domain-containing protein [Candidatus Micrarchaeota archaeon]|nr:ATP cone domain-containing protein [Candidatus Micrarchaeota archaeon]
MADIIVRKGDGTSEILNYNKIRHALRKSGASGALCDEVVELLAPRMKNGITTDEIYRMAFESLREMRPGAAARFGLKSALLRLGPDGYPFETFVGALLKGRGYSTLLRQTLQGKCIQHEIDVVAKRGAYEGHAPTKCIIECKFHNSPHFECHIQSALYSWARFLDVREQNRDIVTGWLATNTKFSGDVIAYADCVGLKLLGWSFPQNESIQIRIEENQLYPTTVLPSLSRRSFEALHANNIITVKELLAAPVSELTRILPEREIGKLKDEAKKVLSSRG